ncbi:MAG: GGDEF domain-containing phosphodiesterase [Acidimicrobiales bacterium]|nr:GGDEF domain-containing phosphodiesterase [Acidimicrobiales bacterium]
MATTSEFDLDAAHRLLSDHVSDLVAVFDTRGILRSLNRSGRRMLRIDANADLPALRIADLVATSDQDRVDDIVRSVHAGTPWSGPLTMRATATGDFPTRSTLCTIPGPEGDAIGWVAKDTTTDRDVIKSLRERAFYDPLTGLSHRSLFLDRLDLLLRRVDEETTPVCVLFVTPDRFKEKVSHFEQGASSLLLKAIAKRIPEHLDGGQSLHRWGDEDFVVLCETIADDAAAAEVAARIAEAFVEPFRIARREVYLTVSTGVAVGSPGEMTTDELIRHADAAAQLARSVPGGAIRMFDAELRARAVRRAELEDALHGAGERGELVLFYQPEVQLRTNQIVACEALLRWRHPTWGVVSPGEFIPVAESSNLIIDIGTWVLHEALTQCAKWEAQFPERPPLTVAVNISARQFAMDDFEQRIADVLDETGCRPSSICLEITEGVLLDDAEETISKLNDLKELGVQLAIDDFGTGYSSLSYLRRFPVDILKVDQAFVSGLGHDPEDSAIVQAVVHMGQALQMTTLAEGVETAHHVIELRELDCDIAQGFHFARPLPVEAFTAMLAAGDDWLDQSMG